MSLVQKLYNIGNFVSDDDFINLLKTDFDASSYTVLSLNFSVNNQALIKKPTLTKTSLDKLDTFFTKAIGGRGSGYFYLYPNFIYQKKSDFYKKFKNTASTFEKSVLVFANEQNQNLAKPVFEYIKNYEKDELGFKTFSKNDYLLIFTINGKTIRELMPEILTNFIQNFVFVHSKTKFKKGVDFITQKEDICGYNPDVKFFTFDNYHDKFKEQITTKLPLSKKSASNIKKGWMYIINNLKFYHGKLEYIIIPSIAKFDEKAYKIILDSFKKAQKTYGLEDKASKEDILIRKLQKEVGDLETIRSSYVDLYFIFIDKVNLSVKIFGSMENLLPSKIRDVGAKMMEQKVCDYYSIGKKKDGFLYLSDYFATYELFVFFGKAKGSLKEFNRLLNKKENEGIKNKILQEKIYLTKLLLGYEKIEYSKLLDKFEHFREFDFKNKKKLNDKNIKKWIEFSDNFIQNEDKTIKFLDSINAIKRS